MERKDDFLIQHVNVNVEDLDAAIAFYRDILGLPLDGLILVAVLVHIGLLQLGFP